MKIESDSVEIWSHEHDGKEDDEEKKRMDKNGRERL